MKARLVRYQEDAIDMVFPLGSSRTTIGRATDNMVQLPDDQVSKHHAVIHHSEGAWTIEDTQSRNGVSVNGAPTVRTELKPGDRIRLGPYEFFFETHAPSEDFVPSHIIDVSTHVGDQTILTRRPPPSA
jgi:pSer/pThr/pTyr-binding forkhead associated (FHA) protein